MSAVFLRFEEPVPYAVAGRLQMALVQARLDQRTPDLFLLLQHPPVITLGRRERRDALLASVSKLAAAGIELAVSDRGGDVTYHGPGQWVLYPILRLDRRASGAHGFLHRLEEVAIRTAAAFGVQAYRRTGKSGAWTGCGKIAAIGFRIRRGITSHGMSLNVEPDLPGFDYIIPCGLVGEPVTSLGDLLGPVAPSLGEVSEQLRTCCAEVFDRPLSAHSSIQLPAGKAWADIVAQALNAPPTPEF